MNMDHGGVFITASELFLLAGNPEWALMISRSASLCEILGARTGVTRAISTCLTSTFAIHNWHKTFGPSISSKISRRLRQRESKSRSFLEVVNPEGLRPTYTMLNTSTFRHAHQENV